MFTRTRYQNGSIRVKKRGKGQKVWEFRYYEQQPNGERISRSATIGTLQQYPSEAAARKSSAVQSILMRVNSEHPLGSATAWTFGGLVTRYELEEMPARHSTRLSYQSQIRNQIRPRWGDAALDAVKPMAVEEWLRKLTLAPKTKTHVKTLMSTIFQCGQRWGVVKSNPMELVRVKDATKRLERPVVITADQFHQLLEHIREPYQTMVLVAGCLGLRAGEIVGLQWDDFDFDGLTVLVQRSIVHGRVGDVKTEYSRDHVPLDEALAAALLKYRDGCHPTEAGWLFANPATNRPYHQEEVQKTHIRRAAKAAGIAGKIGWKTFRHSYRSWLDQTAAPIGVQRELMRHASVQTTMNVYGRAMSQGKRQAHGNVVQMVLKTAAEPAKAAVVG